MPGVLALGDLVEIAVLLFCFAFVWTVRKLLEALFGWLISLLESIPAVGGYLANTLRSAEQSVANALGGVEHAIDAAMGASWHLLARFMGEIWHVLVESATGYALLAKYVANLVYAHSGLKSLVQGNVKAQHVSARRVRVLEREYNGIEAKVRTLEREYHGIDQPRVNARLGKLEAEAANIENVQLPAAEAAQRQAESAINNLYDWAKGKASLLGVGTFSVAVAAALDVLGLGGLRCPSFLRSLSNRGCGLWNGLEDVLGLLFDVAIIASICDVLPWLSTGVDEIGLGLVETIHAAGLSACSGSYPPPPPMPYVDLVLPAVYGTALTTAA